MSETKIGPRQPERILATRAGAIVVGAALLLAGGEASGDVLAPRLALGGQILPGTQAVEVTLQPTPFGPHLSLGLRGGAESSHHVYAEVAGSFWVTVGVGIGRLYEKRADDPTQTNAPRVAPFRGPTASAARTLR